MDDLTTSGEFDLLLVPGVAFDARCNRLGHGKGYYDTFIEQARARHTGGTVGGPLAVVGLGLELQVVEEVPVGDNDQRLDAVVHPAGRLAFASAADLEAAAAYRASADATDVGDGGDGCAGATKRSRDGSPAREAEGCEVALSDRVDLAEGRCGVRPAGLAVPAARRPRARAHDSWSTRNRAPVPTASARRRRALSSGAGTSTFAFA